MYLEELMGRETTKRKLERGRDKEERKWQIAERYHIE